MRCNYDADEALQRLRFRTVSPGEIPGYMETWSEADATAFEKGFALYNKDFKQIRDTRVSYFFSSVSSLCNLHTTLKIVVHSVENIYLYVISISTKLEKKWVLHCLNSPCISPTSKKGGFISLSLTDAIHEQALELGR
ncbi:unnamed protein product [Echinostoma caproni]|uniref:ELM2 domain-containing protein n=1 Tax=Echinostoma caproni TaxID=27848 RepID=A0A183BAP8_9TREM|nr:unnamed protein product [Echinostoma caproni]